MRHSNFCKRNSMSDGCYNAHLNGSMEMIQRKYPEYDGTQYVLWIVSELFHNYKSESILGHVDIIKKDGTMVEIKQIVRTPYPNKMIHQVSTVVGRKRVYGIPLIFSTFEELCEIQTVHSQFDIFTLPRLWDNDMPVELNIDRLDVTYHLNFTLDKERDDFKFFTVFSKDDVLAGYDDYHIDRDIEYFEQFDIALCAEGVIDIMDGEALVDNITFFQNDTRTYDTETRDIVDEVHLDFAKDLPDNDFISSLAKQAKIKNQAQYCKYIYERTETMTATELPDILTEPSFGFKQI